MELNEKEVKRKKRGPYVKRPKTPCRPLVMTHHLMEERYERLNIVSLRKKLCLLYVRWGAFADKKAKLEFVELSKVWRKEENKYGMKRTKLERIARRLYQWARKQKSINLHRQQKSEAGKAAKASKRGIHVKDNGELEKKRREGEKKFREEHRATRKRMGKSWIVVSPEGEVQHIHNLQQFCDENGLCQRHMSCTARIPGAHHKGWRAQHWDPDWVDLAHKMDDL